MYPRSVFFFCIVVPFFVPSFRSLVASLHFLYPCSGFGGPGNIRQNHPFSTIFRQHQFQRTPWGGWKKRGEENLTKPVTKDTLPKTLRLVHFPPPSGVVALFFLLHRSPRLSTPEALLEGSEKLSGGWFVWYVFLPTIRFAPPDIMGQPTSEAPFRVL